MSTTSLKRLQSVLIIFSTLMIISHFISNSAQAWENPGWGNAEKVCASPRIGGDSPDLGFKNQKSSIETGFYRIGPLPDDRQRVLGVNEATGAVELVSANTKQATDWLVTLVGADLYQISTCQSGIPRCLILSESLSPELGACKHEAYGTQAWWSIGIVHGPGAGGLILGNDSVGHTDCLIENPDGGIISLSPCEASGKPNITWQFTHLENTKNAVNTITYRCESDEIVQTSYHTTSDHMQVRYKGQLLTLTPVISGSGAKFGGEQAPWGWWTKADEGYIFGYNSDGTETGPIENCVEIEHEATAPPTTTIPEEPTLDTNRSWAPNGVYEKIILTDCHDCGDDIGMTVTCHGPGKAAVAAINWAATDTAKPDPFITIEIAGQTYKRNARTKINGMLGLVPEFDLHSDDPIVAALMTASAAKFTFGEVSTQIGLRGSKFAFEIFDAHCRWKEAARDTLQSAKSSTRASNTSGDAVWYRIKYIDEATNTEKSELHFGVPETDNTALIASCEANTPSASIDLLVDTGTQEAGTALDVRFETETFDQTYQGHVFLSNAAYRGVTLLLATTDPLWAAFARGTPLRLSLASGAVVQLNSAATAKTVTEWRNNCRPQ